MAFNLCECGKVKTSNIKKYCEDCRIEKKIGEHAEKNPYCPSCKNIKENRNSGYCLACERERWQERNKPDCATCGAIKENPRDSYCNGCKRDKAREKSLIEGRQIQNPKGSGRSIFCSSCKKEKEPGRDNESCCKSCKSERNKLKRIKKREELGMRPYGSGLKLTCCCCGELKEKQEYGYCNSCRRKKDNEKRLSSGVTKKHNTGLCPCGKERAPYSSAYCIDCLAIRMQERKVRYPLTDEQKDRKNELQNARRRDRGQGIYGRKIITLTEEERLIRNHARNLCRKRIAAGILIKQPCEVCGKDTKIEAHHDDYSKPLEVRWLCVYHHNEHHRNENDKY